MSMRKYSESYLKLGFTSIQKGELEAPQCVICGKVLGNQSMKPSLLKRHFDSVHPEHSDKDHDFFRRKENAMKRARFDGSGSFQQQSTAAVKASYLVALRIAEQKKPHTVGESLILPATKDIVRLMLGEQSAKKLNSLSLSNNTVQRRIEEMSTNIRDQVVAEIKASPCGFSMQLDESTDVANCAQLLAFVRYVHKAKFKDEILFCRPLKTTTKAKDIFEEVSSVFDQVGLSWVDLKGCTTDGAPAMLGCRSGFQTLVKAVAPEVRGLHCTIHRHALAAKALPKPLTDVLSTMIKIVNHVKSQALNSRLFKKLCEDFDSDHKVLLFHTEVRWLSRGNMAERVFELRAELREFFENDGKPKTVDFVAALNDPDWALHLAYLVDIFSQLNALNKSLQGTGATIIDFIDKVKGFQEKLRLWKTNVEAGVVVMFSCTADILQKREKNPPREFIQLVKDHLASLDEELNSYFPDLKELDLKMIRNPFRMNALDLPPGTGLQESLIDLQNDSTARDQFDEMNLADFWCGMLGSYPKLAALAVHSLIVFPSTWLCEAGFSSVVILKTKQRSLLDVEHDVRCALSKTKPDIDLLVSKKQAQPSH